MWLTANDPPPIGGPAVQDPLKRAEEIVSQGNSVDTVKSAEQTRTFGWVAATAVGGLKKIHVAVTVDIHPYRAVHVVAAQCRKVVVPD